MPRRKIKIKQEVTLFDNSNESEPESPSDVETLNNCYPKYESDNEEDYSNKSNKKSVKQLSKLIKELIENNKKLKINFTKKIEKMNKRINNLEKQIKILRGFYTDKNKKLILKNAEEKMDVKKLIDIFLNNLSNDDVLKKQRNNSFKSTKLVQQKIVNFDKALELFAKKNMDSKNLSSETKNNKTNSILNKKRRRSKSKNTNEVIYLPEII